MDVLTDIARKVQITTNGPLKHYLHKKIYICQKLRRLPRHRGENIQTVGKLFFLYMLFPKEIIFNLLSHSNYSLSWKKMSKTFGKMYSTHIFLEGPVSQILRQPNFNPQEFSQKRDTARVFFQYNSGGNIWQANASYSHRM